MPNCSKFSFNVFSTENSEELILYPDGPCRDTGLARAVVHVTLLPCPDGFSKSDEKCVCEDRLREYGAECTVDDDASITRKNGYNLWMSGFYKNSSYQGLANPMQNVSSGIL